MVGTTVTTRRVTYTIAGQAVASRVQTFSPTAGNTLYRLYTDHLGSTVTHSTMSGGTVTGANTYYLPYGSYRGTPPTQTLTDRDFTGQRENRELGLLYYQARFYVPSIGRFASPDTLVPDPANPQQFNRYTYSLNSPLRYSDPTGHLSEDELEEYFGFVDEQEIIDAYGEAVSDQLRDPSFTWGDVLEYECSSCAGGSGYAILLLLGNQADEFRGALWGLQANHNGHDYRGIEIPKQFLKEARYASSDADWTESYRDHSNIPVNYDAYGVASNAMVSGTWHDYAFWRPALFLGLAVAPGGLIPAALSEGWGVVEEVTDDVLDIGHPLGEYHVGYPTIKVANQWGYLPTANTRSFLAPKSLHE